MTHEHDKEIDSLLRRLAKHEAVTTASAASGGHIDADEISVYAENALPEKAKARITAHLADCGRCRTILSNVVVLNAEENTAAAASPVEGSAGVAIGLEIPWYRKLFAVRGFSMAMGAIAVLLAGLVAIAVIRNISPSGSTVAKLSERSEEANAALPSATVPETAARDNVPASEPVSPEPTPAASTENTNVGGPAKEKDVSVSREEEQPRTAQKKAAKRADDIGLRDLDNQSVPAGQVADTVAPANAGVAGNKPVAQGNIVAASPAPPPPPQAAAEVGRGDRQDEMKTEAAPTRVTRNKVESLSKADAAKLKQRSVTARRVVSGKVFLKRDGVWTDTAYKGEAVTRVNKKADEYKSLDSDLRSIVEKLEPPIVVVWKAKAYRID